MSLQISIQMHSSIIQRAAGQHSLTRAVAEAVGDETEADSADFSYVCKYIPPFLKKH